MANIASLGAVFSSFSDQEPTFHIWGILFAGGLVVTLLVVQFLRSYIRARAQFPGPPVKSFWMGNLDQTMADDVHEKVENEIFFFVVLFPTSWLTVLLSGCNGIVNMDMSSKLCVLCLVQ